MRARRVQATSPARVARLREVARHWEGNRHPRPLVRFVRNIPPSVEECWSVRSPWRSRPSASRRGNQIEAMGRPQPGRAAKRFGGVKSGRIRLKLDLITRTLRAVRLAAADK